MWHREEDGPGKRTRGFEKREGMEMKEEEGKGGDHGKTTLTGRLLRST